MENKWGANWARLGEGKLDRPWTTHPHFVWGECWGGADQDRDNNDGGDGGDDDKDVEMTNMVDEIFEDESDEN